jgi:hypothetical protein
MVANTSKASPVSCALRLDHDRSVEVTELGAVVLVEERHDPEEKRKRNLKRLEGSMGEYGLVIGRKER